MSTAVTEDPWKNLRKVTPARVALGRAGAALPTDAVLDLALAHARARDAVHVALDAEAIEQSCTDLGFAAIRVRSAAPDRRTYLRRPDLGRTLGPEDRTKLLGRNGPFDLALIVADGLSSPAVHAHAAPMLNALRPYLQRGGLRCAHVVIAEQARVALGDAIGALLEARMTVMLIGERPGLSSPDSLGIYLTFSPRIGRTDAERNCISNIRHEGLDYETAAHKLFWLIAESFRLGKSGIELKDMSDLILAAPSRLQVRE